MKKTTTNYKSAAFGVRLAAVAVLLTATTFLTVTAFMQEKSGQSVPKDEHFATALIDEKRNSKTPVTKGKLPGPNEQNVDGPTIQVASNHAFSAANNGSLTDMSTGTTQLLGANVDDTASSLTSIGFDFYFQGARFTQFSINDNGVLRLGATAQTASPYKPLAQASISIITAYGADQRTHAGDGKVHFKVIGAAPNRTLVIEWLNNQSNFNTGGTADLTYQVRLNETTGVMEFVYGSMTMSTLGAADVNSRDPNIGFSSSNTAGTVGSVTAPQGGAPAPTFDGASATPVANLYTAGAITTLTSASQGTRRIFSFAPPTPTAPTALNFTGVTQLAMTLNWTDSPNETLYAVYRSTDGVNYSFDGTAAQNATSYAASSLSPSVTYFWRVFAVSEGALSTALSGSQATTAAGNLTSVQSGNWSDPATWGGSVPTLADNVTIANGHTVTIDSSNALTLTVQSGGILQFEQTTARTLTVTQSVTINSGGTFQSNPAGTVTTHVLSVGTNLTNNGTIDFSTNANTAGAGITFTGAADAAFTLGASSTTDFKQTAGVTLNKGTNNTPILTFTPGGTITVLGANTVGFLTITNGTFKLDGAGAFSNPLFNVAGYAIPATGGFWMNNTNATVVAQNGTGTVTGLFRMTLGTFNLGTGAGSALAFATGSNINVEGGAINSSGRVAVTASGNAITYNQSGGTITVCRVGNTSTTLASFDLGTGVGTTNITGGTIVVQLANTAVSGPRDYRNQSGLTGTTTVTGGTLQLGNAASGAAKAFSIAGVVPNLVIDNTSAGHTATFLAPAVFNNVTRNITINPGTALNIGNNVFLMNGTTLTNNGTLTANGASSNFVWFLSTSPQSYTGSGTVTAPVTNFAVQSDMGLTIDPASPNIVVGAIRLFSGSVINSNRITLGNGGATTGIVQIGNTTTPTAAGTFDVPFTFNLGTGGQTVSYLRTTASRNTGPEINPTRTLTSFTYDDNDITHSLTLTGGDLTVTGTTALTNGHVVTGANTQIVGSAGTVTRTTGLVDGNFRKTYAAAGIKVFEVGTANAFSPATINATAGTFPADITVKAVQGKQPNVPGTNALQRYWTLTAPAGVTADLTLQYLPADVVGTEASYQVLKYTGTFTNPAGSSVNAGADQLLAPGQAAFSADWTAAEAGALTPGSLQFSSPTYSVAENVGGGIAIVTVTRTGGTAGAASINYATSNGTANGGVACGANVDYVNASGTLNWADADGASKTFNLTICNEALFEGDETVNLSLTGATGASAGAPANAVLTITNDDPPTPPNAGDLIISEFRLRGPGGVDDEFIEIYNDSGADLTVQAADASAGLAVAASDGVARCVIPNGQVIRAGGHFLCTNSGAYSLSGYPAGNGTFATPDLTYALSIPDNAGIAIFNNATGGASFSIANRLDAVGSASEANPVYKEGTGYPDLLTTLTVEHSVLRNLISGIPKDTDDNVSDFVFVDTQATCLFIAGCASGPTADGNIGGRHLGAPSPENLSSPIQRNATIKAFLIDNGCSSSSGAGALSNTTCARHRDLTVGPLATNGTLSIRRTFKNNTGVAVTRLRFRVVDLTTNPPVGTADLRLLTSGSYSATCVSTGGGCVGTGSVITIEGTALETPPAQPNGGGLNSSMTVTLGGPLVSGASINLQFLLGVQSGGTYRFFINVEALP